MRQDVASKIEEIAQRVVSSEGMELVSVELKGTGPQRLVRIYIDKPTGVNHGDCELVSQQVGAILDVEDVVPGGRYTLEVSSPGAERQLNRAQDYERFQGKKAHVLLREPVDGRTDWEGRLAGLADGMVELETGQDRTIRFPLELVKRANLKLEW